MMTDSRHSDMLPRSLLTKRPVNPTAGVCQQATFSSQPFQQLPLLQKATLIKVTHTITDQRGNINLNILPQFGTILKGHSSSELAEKLGTSAITKASHFDLSLCPLLLSPPFCRYWSQVFLNINSCKLNSILELAFLGTQLATPWALEERIFGKAVDEQTLLT